MTASIEPFEELIRSAARRLRGHQRRLFQAEVATHLCGGNPRLAERRFGWGRDAVAWRSEAEGRSAWGEARGVEGSGRRCALLRSCPPARARYGSRLLLYFAPQNAPSPRSCTGVFVLACDPARPGASGGGRSEVKEETSAFRRSSGDMSGVPRPMLPAACTTKRIAPLP